MPICKCFICLSVPKTFRKVPRPMLIVAPEEDLVPLPLTIPHVRGMLQGCACMHGKHFSMIHAAA